MFVEAWAWTCPFCGWDNLSEALAENDWVPYCCRDAERMGQIR